MEQKEFLIIDKLLELQSAIKREASLQQLCTSIYI